MHHVCSPRCTPTNAASLADLAFIFHALGMASPVEGWLAGRGPSGMRCFAWARAQSTAGRACHDSTAWWLNAPGRLTHTQHQQGHHGTCRIQPVPCLPAAMQATAHGCTVCSTAAPRSCSAGTGKQRPQQGQPARCLRCHPHTVCMPTASGSSHQAHPVWRLRSSPTPRHHCS